MRALMFVPAAAALLAGCYDRPASAPGSALAAEVAGRVAGPPQSCIPSQPQQGLRIVDPATLAYGYGRTVYINRLSAPCPGIEPPSTLIVEPGLAGSYCRGDRVRGQETGANIPGPTCILNQWTPYRSQ